MKKKMEGNKRQNKTKEMEKKEQNRRKICFGKEENSKQTQTTNILSAKNSCCLSLQLVKRFYFYSDSLAFLFLFTFY
jgi:hypothetical protein